MNVGTWSRLGLAIAVIAGMSQVARAEGSRPSQQTLRDMGLGGLVVMSDDEAASIRGQGFKGYGRSKVPRSSVSVFGTSSATINTPKGTAHSQNGYLASGAHHASGKNGSHAGVVKKTSIGFGRHNVTKIHSTTVFAGGYSSGFAF